MLVFFGAINGGMKPLEYCFNAVDCCVILYSCVRGYIFLVFNFITTHGSIDTCMLHMVVYASHGVPSSTQSFQLVDHSLLPPTCPTKLSQISLYTLPLIALVNLSRWHYVSPQS